MMSDEDWPDPKKWYYEEQSGEFYPITEILRDGSPIYSIVPYSKRWSDWYNGVKGVKVFRNIFLAFGAVSVVAGALGTTGGVMFAVLGGLATIAFGGVWLLLKYNARWLEKRVGPEPRRRIVEAPVHQQPAVTVINAGADYSGKMS